MKREIDSKSLFGYEYYSRKRIKENLIDINSEKVKCDNVGLYAFTRKLKLITNDIEFFDKT